MNKQGFSFSLAKLVDLGWCPPRLIPTARSLILESQWYPIGLSDLNRVIEPLLALEILNSHQGHHGHQLIDEKSGEMLSMIKLDNLSISQHHSVYFEIGMTREESFTVGSIICSLLNCRYSDLPIAAVFMEGAMSPRIDECPISLVSRLRLRGSLLITNISEYLGQVAVMVVPRYRTINTLKGRIPETNMIYGDSISLSNQLCFPDMPRELIWKILSYIVETPFKNVESCPIINGISQGISKTEDFISLTKCMVRTVSYDPRGGEVRCVVLVGSDGSLNVWVGFYSSAQTRSELTTGWLTNDAIFNHEIHRGNWDVISQMEAIEEIISGHMLELY